MADILVSEDIRGTAIDTLRRERDVDFAPELWRSPTELQRRIRGVQALLVRNQTHVTAELIGAASDLKIVGRAGAGLDNIDLEAASRAGIVVASAAHDNSVSVAELTIGLMIALARNISAADRHVRADQWDRHRFVGMELSGKVLGIVGFGYIGQLVAQRARALEMQIITYDAFLDKEMGILSQHAARWLPFEKLLAQSDVISCHVPLTQETIGLFDFEQFRQMKSTALFINTSRGEVVDEPGLAQALEQGLLAGAALDVRQQEPPKPSPLSEMEQVILTPHIAAFTHEAQQRVVRNVCRDICLVLDGQEAIGFCNFPVPGHV